MSTDNSSRPIEHNISGTKHSLGVLAEEQKNHRLIVRSQFVQKVVRHRFPEISMNGEMFILRMCPGRVYEQNTLLGKGVEVLSELWKIQILPLD